MKKYILPSLDELNKFSLNEFLMMISLFGFVAYLFYSVICILTDVFADINLKDILLGEFKIVRSPLKSKIPG